MHVDPPALPSGKTSIKTPAHPSLTSEMPHLRILPRSRLCQNLARRNARRQVFGYVPAEHILAAARRRGG
jgi:hypothetical protein